MLEIIFTEYYARAYKKLGDHLKQEVREAIVLFRNPANHKRLRLHKLHGRLSAYHSFSVNYNVRIIVRIVKKKTVVLLIDIGDHSLYE
ncbi:type II toxin-antitoxin system mRNA interferase toxin, RelE/StbE family [Candidatus Kaiserbacteria bacterium]|nr:type II toxin-antitoxin system mRNA interferase toxin, RelE/StbE family [Candidatus Kaiserbacteria bacterium]